MKRSHLFTSESTSIRLLLAIVVLLLATCTPAGPAAMYGRNGSGTQKSTSSNNRTAPVARPPITARESSTMPAATASGDGKTGKLQPPAARVEGPLPRLGSTLSPPRDDCVVYQNGRVRYKDLPYIRSSPSTKATIIGRLGDNHWALGLQVQNGWYEIVVSPGQTGWVHKEGVGDNSQCDADPAQLVPVIMNRGAPANYRCVAMRTEFNPESPPVYSAPNRQSTLVARLHNWAEVRVAATGWYEITIPQGGTGWVEAGQVELSFGCD